MLMSHAELITWLHAYLAHGSAHADARSLEHVLDIAAKRLAKIESWAPEDAEYAERDELRALIKAVAPTCGESLQVDPRQLALFAELRT